MFSRFTKGIGLSSAVLTLTGCVALGSPQSTQAPPFEEGKSFAYNVSMLSHINTPKNSDRHLDDVELDKVDMQAVESASADLLGVGLGIGMFAFPASVGSAFMSGFTAGSFIVSALAGPPAVRANADGVVAWFPADQAGSPIEAMDKFHAIRLAALKRSLDEQQMKYEQTYNLDSFRVVPWGTRRNYTELVVKDYKDLCLPDNPCKFAVNTVEPKNKVVIAPKELTGQSYPAYLFAGGKPTRGFEINSTRAWTNNKDADGEFYGVSRDFDTQVWMNKYAPDWSVSFTSLPSPQRSGMRMNNPFPFIVHKGEIKLFAVERKHTVNK